jgi:hypothetical protein
MLEAKAECEKIKKIYELWIKEKKNI